MNKKLKKNLLEAINWEFYRIELTDSKPLLWSDEVLWTKDHTDFLSIIRNS